MIYTKEEYQNAYAELLIIFKYLPEDILRRIPKETIKYYINNANNNGKIVYRKDIPLLEQEFTYLTKVIFANLYIEYIISEKGKQKIIQEEHEKELQAERKKKQEYKDKQLFKQKEINDNDNANTNLPISKKDISLISRIIGFIKKHLKKR